MTNFSNMGLHPSVLRGLADLEIVTPTPIQNESIPIIMEGGDVVASAQTGTGKTIAYLAPIITKLLENPDDMLLVLAPTRELAAQVKDCVYKLTKGVSTIKSALIIGGESMGKQFDALRRRPNIIIGTPGRINDHIRRGSLMLKLVKYAILDETDRMLDMGFSEDLDKIFAKVPAERQTLMFSATMDKTIEKVAQKYLRDPKRVTVGSVSEPSQQITQEILQVNDDMKFATLLKQLEERAGSIIVFVKTKINAERLKEKLQAQDHSADAIHGDLKQNKRDRAIRMFRSERNRIMVATDVAARGIDIPHVRHVINYDLPQCPEDYIHRIGRTGRAGLEGNAMSFVSSSEYSKWRAIVRLVGDHLPTLKMDSSPRPKKKSGSSGGGGYRDSKPRDFGGKNRFKPKTGFGAKRRDDQGNGFESGEKKRRFDDKPRSEAGRGNRKFDDRPRSDAGSSGRKFDDKPRSEAGHGNRKFDDRPRSDAGSSGRKFNDNRKFGDSKKPGSSAGRPSNGRKAANDRPFGSKPAFGKPKKKSGGFKRG